MLISLVAHGAELQTEGERLKPIAGHPVFDIRLGADAVGNGESQVQPYFCGEVAPLPVVSIEACGNGSGVLHRMDGPDIAHFRLRARVLERRQGMMDASLMVAAGFIEVQRGLDEPGFRFGAAEEGQVEASGPEVSAGLKGRYWLGSKTYLTGDFTVGSGYVVGAPLVMGWASPVVPFASLTVGMGL